MEGYFQMSLPKKTRSFEIKWSRSLMLQILEMPFLSKLLRITQKKSIWRTSINYVFEHEDNYDHSSSTNLWMYVLKLVMTLLMKIYMMNKIHLLKLQHT